MGDAKYLKLALVKGLTLLLSLFYAWSVEWSYKTVVTPYFEYMGYVLYKRELTDHVLALFFVSLGALALPHRVKTPSQLVGILLFSFVYVPSLVISTVVLSVSTAALFRLHVTLFLAFAAYLLWSYVPLPKKRFRCLAVSPVLWVSLIGVLAFVLLFYLVVTLGLKPPPSIFDPYEVRIGAREAGPLVGYTVRILGNVFGPVLVIAGVIQGRRSWVFLGVFLHVMVFSFDGTKSTLFMPVMLVGFLIILTIGRGLTNLVITATIALIVVSTWVDIYLGSPLVSSFLVRRLIVTPGVLTSFYYEYFTDNPVFWWGHSVLRFFVDSPYDTSPAFLIGYEYFGSDLTSANANLWADGFANAGVFGALLVSVIAGAFFKVADWLSIGRGLFGLLVWLAPSFALVNSAFLTSVLTHGLAITAVIVLGAPRRLCKNE